ncbi:MAG: hypothetical protein UU47_C0023G0003 [candidate division TM6 bacterium GW2011_GWE2_41_16]|nr:MAG: hypothetical protein UU47_C0023G0003 [candidate division TM6 bacterium GW2011_GWE2_41_16]
MLGTKKLTLLFYLLCSPLYAASVCVFNLSDDPHTILLRPQKGMLRTCRKDITKITAPNNVHIDQIGDTSKLVTHDKIGFSMCSIESITIDQETTIDLSNSSVFDEYSLYIFDTPHEHILRKSMDKFEFIINKEHTEQKNQSTLSMIQHVFQDSFNYKGCLFDLDHTGSAFTENPRIMQALKEKK